MLVRPTLELLNTLQYQGVGMAETILTCIVTGYPLGLSYWSKNGLQIKNSADGKYSYNVKVS